jgi:branched-chain amino acid transport system substrate-binding protein
MKKIVDFHKAKHPNDSHDLMYVRGWSYVVVWSEALRRADKAGQLTSEGVRTALETFRDFDMGGIAANVTYTPTDHRPTTKVPVYQIRDGKLAKIAEYDMPRKAEWLGQ